MAAGSSLDPLSLLTALAAGLLSFLSPCVLPLMPAYIGLITGRSAEELRTAGGGARYRVAVHGAAFVLGLALIFALLGASATLLGQLLLDNQQVLFRVGGTVAVALGLHTMGLLPIQRLYRTSRLLELRPNVGQGALGAFFVGLAFGAGWTPCVGPFLASLLAVAATRQTAAQGTLLLLLYALGLGLPFLLAGVAIERALGVAQAVRPHLRSIERGSGVLLVGMGVLLFTDQLARLSAWFVGMFGQGFAA